MVLLHPKDVSLGGIQAVAMITEAVVVVIFAVIVVVKTTAVDIAPTVQLMIVMMTTATVNALLVIEAIPAREMAVPVMEVTTEIATTHVVAGLVMQHQLVTMAKLKTGRCCSYPVYLTLLMKYFCTMFLAAEAILPNLTVANP